MNVVQSIVVGYSPPSVAGVMREYLRDFGRLEALLYSFEQSRAFRYVEPWCAGIAMTFVMAEHDPEDVRQSTQEIIDTHSKEPWALVDVPGAGHFFVQDDGAAAAALIARSLSQA
jgi:alpha/beta superfamily hydrolase